MDGKQVYRLSFEAFPPPFGGSSSKEENLHRGVLRAGAATPDNCQTTAAARWNSRATVAVKVIVDRGQTRPSWRKRENIFLP